MNTDQKSHPSNDGESATGNDADSAKRSGGWPKDSQVALASMRLHPWWTAAGALVVAIVILALLWDWNWFKGPIERAVQSSTGRELRIDGDLDVDLGWVSTISAERVHFANADWSKTPEMLAVDRIEVDLALWPLLSGHVRVPGLRLDRPRGQLETGPKGGGNWVFDKASDEGGFELQFRRIRINDGQLRFLDAANDTDIRVDIATDDKAGAAKANGKGPVAKDNATDKQQASGDRPTSARIVVDGGGRWEGNVFTLQGRADSPLDLQDTESPYRIEAKAKAGATRAEANGTLLDPLKLADFDLQLKLSGQDLADLYPLLGVAIPPTPPYTLDGRLTRDGTTWHYDDFTGKVGDSDLAGDASVDVGGERPYLRGDLVSKKLDFDDLAGFVGGAPQAGRSETSNPELTAKAAKAAASSRVLPDTPYKLDKLRSMDADVKLTAGHINAPDWPLDDMVAHLMLEDGVLRLDPLNFGVANGDLHSTIHMDARKDTIRTRADISARGLDLAKLMPKVELAQNAIGKVGGKIAVDTSGNSIADMLGNSSGDVVVGMGRGKISNMLMEVAGIDLAEMLKFALTEDRLIPVRCAFGDFTVKDGEMTARSLAFDTTDTILIGSGKISLRNETLDLSIKPRPKDRSLLSLRTPLKVDGTFKNPDIGPDIGRLGLRGAIALALGSVAPPLALLGTLELGPGEDSGCGGQYAK